jgi:predicted transcriptional regulator
MNSNLNKLTKAEEEIMQHIWELDRCTVSDVIKRMGMKEKIPHSTISSIVRILEKKGYLDHKAYGRTYEYFPIITKETYSKKTIRSIVSNYFQGSMNELVSFLVKEKDIDIQELSELIEEHKKGEDHA